MTDERIKEERNKTAKIIVARLLGSLEATPLNISMIETLLVEYEVKTTRTAERLAKIEVLEEVRKAMDNRKCKICDFVFDQDCDDCPAMPMMIKMWKDRSIIQQQVQLDNGVKVETGEIPF